MTREVSDIVARDHRRDNWYKIFHEKGAVRRFLARKLFSMFEMMGLHITADHFYEIIPNTRRVAETYSADRRPCSGIEFPLAAAEALVLQILDRWANEFYELSGEEGYYENNSYFRGVDAMILYCLVRELKPPRVIEVGHGFSTRVILAALRANQAELGGMPAFISIDPYARFTPTTVAAAAVDFKVHNLPLQDATGLLLSSIESGDLLFVDSSHVFKYGSDVELFFSHVYPKLAVGVYVHVHDVFSPYDYPLEWICHQKRFWNEQYHIEDFLRFNNSFEVVLPLHLLMRESESVKRAVHERITGGHHLFVGQSMYIRRRA